MQKNLLLILTVIGAAGAVFYFWNQSKTTKANAAAAAVAIKEAKPVAQDHTNKYLDLASQILATF